MAQLPLAKSLKSKPETQHLVVEISQITDQNLIDGVELVQLLQTFCYQLGLNVVNHLSYQFQPQGFSVVFILQESHLAAHSWPEIGYLHLDMLTCGTLINLEKIQTFWKLSLPESIIKVIELKY